VSISHKTGPRRGMGTYMFRKPLSHPDAIRRQLVRTVLPFWSGRKVDVACPQREPLFSRFLRHHGSTICLVSLAGICECGHDGRLLAQFSLLFATYFRDSELIRTCIVGWRNAHGALFLVYSCSVLAKRSLDPGKLVSCPVQGTLH